MITRISRFGRWGRTLVTAGLMLAATTVFNTAQAAYHALLVGIDHYSPAYGPGTLPSCVNDANGFRTKILGDTTRWSSTRIHTKVDSAATEAAIKSYLQAKSAALVAGDVFVYFHSSHGGTLLGPGHIPLHV